jgi:hypothetical protein
MKHSDARYPDEIAEDITRSQTLPATEGLMDRRSAAACSPVISAPWHAEYLKAADRAIRMEIQRDEARREAERWRDCFKTGMRLELENLRQYVNELEIVRKQRDEAVHLASEAVKLAR